MIRVRSLLVLAMVLLLGATFVTVVDAAEGRRRGSGRGSLLGLLRMEQVQKELKLSEEETAKVKTFAEKHRAEMRKQYEGIREIEDREKRRAKWMELRDQSDRKAHEAIRKILPREKMIRLYQIRLQVRAVVDSLANKYVSGKLKLTDEQKAKLAQIVKDSQAARSELYGSMRDASEEQRREAYAKYRKIRSDADEEALGLLTAEQKEALEKMKGEKIELPSRGGR